MLNVLGRNSTACSSKPGDRHWKVASRRESRGKKTWESEGILLGNNGTTLRDVLDHWLDHALIRQRVYGPVGLVV
jgi:hypothetical protein